jgi:hypothetical protein
MAELSHCVLKHQARTLVRPGALFCVMSLLATVVALGLVQLELRFENRDLEVETRFLQRERATLLEQKKMLLAEEKRQERYETVQQTTEHLGLRECMPDQTCEATVSPRLLAKWEVNEAAVPSRGMKRQPSAAEKFLATVEEKVSLATVSLARDKEK